MILCLIQGPGSGGQAPAGTRGFFRIQGRTAQIKSSQCFLLSLAKDGAGPIPFWKA